MPVDSMRGDVGGGVVAVVLAFDAERVLEATLEAIDAQTWPVLATLVVDNGSTDHTAEVARRHEGVDVLETGRNLGVGGGHNAGWDEARRRYPGLRWIWALEHDSLPAPDCLGLLVGALDGHGSRSVALPQQATDVEAERDDTAPTIPWKRLTFNGLLVPRELTAEVGPIDPDYFVGFEDRDFAWRLRRAGWEILRVQSAKVGHANRKKKMHLSADREYYGSRNQLHLHLHVRHRRLFSVGLLVRGIGRALLDAFDARRRRSGHTKARMIGLWHGLRGVRGQRP